MNLLVLKVIFYYPPGCNILYITVNNSHHWLFCNSNEILQVVILMSFKCTEEQSLYNIFIFPSPLAFLFLFPLMLNLQTNWTSLILKTKLALMHL